MAQEWQERQKLGSDSLSGKSKSASNKEEVDYSAIYCPSLGYGDLGYGNLGYGPSLEERARSLQPTRAMNRVDWSRVTPTLRTGQDSEAGSNAANFGEKKSVAGDATETATAMPTSYDKTLQQSDIASDHQAKAPSREKNSELETRFQAWMRFQNSISKRAEELSVFWLEWKKANPQIARDIERTAQEIYGVLLKYVLQNHKVSIEDKDFYSKHVRKETIIYNLMAQKSDRAQRIINGETEQHRERERQSLFNLGQDTSFRRSQLDNFLLGENDRNNSFGGIKEQEKRNQVFAQAAEIYRRVTQYDWSWQDGSRSNTQTQELYAACTDAATLLFYGEAQEIVGGSTAQRGDLNQLFYRLPQQSPPDKPNTASQELINNRSRQIFQAITGTDSPRNRAEQRLLETLRNAILIQWNVKGAARITDTPESQSESRSTSGQNPQSQDPVERFKQRLTQKALQQLYENDLHIQRAREKYQDPANASALGRLRQVVEADKRLESTQKQLEKRSQNLESRFRIQTTRETARAPQGTGPNAAELRAQLDQNQAKVNEIKQVRGTLLALYPASGLLKVGEVKETNSDAQLLATLKQRFESIFSDIETAKKGIISEDIPLSQLEPLVAATLKETEEADKAAVTSYLQGERQRENTFRLVGFLGQIGLTIAAIFTGGLAGAIMGSLAATLGVGQAVYEFEQADDLNTIAKTGQAGGNQLLADPDAAQFNYVMGWVNLVLAGIDTGLALREGGQLLVGARAAERLTNRAASQVIFRLPQEKLLRLQEAVRLEKRGDAGAQQLLASLKQELGGDFDETYKLFKEGGLEFLDDVEASRFWGGMARPEGYWIRIIKGKISTVKEGAEEAFYVTREQYDAIQKLPSNQRRTREEIFQNLPPELREQASPTKTRRTIVEKPTRVRSDYLKEYENISLGERIGSGGNKDVYAIQGRNDLAIGILRRGEIAELNTEIEVLQRIESEGLQTVEVLGTTTHNGNPAIIMKKYAQGSKGIVRSIDAKPGRVDSADISLLNQNSIDDLEKISSILQRKQIYIDDLQFLIAEDGRVYITDPIDINTRPTTPDMERNANMIQLLIDAANENISKSKT